MKKLIIQYSNTLRELINAELFIVEIIFADEGSKRACFVEFIFADQ